MRLKWLLSSFRRIIETIKCRGGVQRIQRTSFTKWSFSHHRQPTFIIFFFYPVPVLIIFVQGIWCDSFRCVIGGVPDALRTRTQAYSGVPYFGIQMLYKYKHTIRILFGKLLSFQTFMNGLTIQDFDFLIASARKMQTHCLSLTFSCIHAYSWHFHDSCTFIHSLWLVLKVF